MVASDKAQREGEVQSVCLLLMLCLICLVSEPFCKTVSIGFASNCALESDRPGNSDCNTHLGGCFW